MLRLAGDQVESLFDELLPAEVRELPAELAVLDRLLADPRLLAPIEQAWEQTARDHGRPTIPMASLVRLMVIKQPTGRGYETLVREVSDSRHLRRFCPLPLTARVPDESTVPKLVRRLGPETVNEPARVVIGKGRRETRFVAGRCGSTPPWSRPTSSIRPTPGWPGRVYGRWLARAASSRVGCLARPDGWWIAPGSSARRCGRSHRRWPGALLAARCGHGAERAGGADPDPVDR
jgi:hypothetical protein